MNNRELTIADFVKLAMKRIWVIVAAMVIGGLIAFYYTNFMITPIYQSQTKYLVDTTDLSGDAVQKSTSAQVEIQRITVLSRLLVSSYIEILDTRNFAEYISEKLSTDERLSRNYTASSIDGLVDFNYEEESESYKVTVSAFDPMDALIIAEYIQNESGNYLNTKKASSNETLQIIDNARMNPNPVNVHVTMYVIVGILVGAMLAFAICFVVELNDVSVRDEKELSEILGLPIIGLIPEYIPASEAGRKYGYAATKMNK